MTEREKINLLSTATTTEERIKIFSTINYQSMIIDFHSTDISDRELLDIVLIRSADIDLWHYLSSIGFKLEILPSHDLINTNNPAFVEAMLIFDKEFIDDARLIEECICGIYAQYTPLNDRIKMISMLLKHNVLFDEEWVLGNTEEDEILSLFQNSEI